MIKYEETLSFIEKVGALISETFGENCEVVVSELDGPDPKILYIFNGHVTNRRAGDPLFPAGAERAENGDDGFCVNYPGTKNGKEIKTSSLNCEFDGHKLSFCINYDYSALVPAQRLLAQLMDVRRDMPQQSGVISSADAAIDEAILRSGKPPRLMTKEDRMNIVMQLNEQGVFNIQRSVITTAQRLGISRFTVYNYLNEINAK